MFDDHFFSKKAMFMTISCVINITKAHVLILGRKGEKIEAAMCINAWVWSIYASAETDICKRTSKLRLDACKCMCRSTAYRRQQQPVQAGEGVGAGRAEHKDDRACALAS